MALEINATSWAVYHWEKDQVLIVKEAGWGLGPLWIDMEYLAPPGFESQTIQPVVNNVLEYQNEINPYPAKVDNMASSYRC